MTSFLIVYIICLFSSFVGTFDYHYGMDEGFTADFCGVDEDSLIFFLHFVELCLLMVVDELYVLIEHFDLPLFLVLTLLDI